MGGTAVEKEAVRPIAIRRPNIPSLVIALLAVDAAVEDWGQGGWVYLITVLYFSADFISSLVRPYVRMDEHSIVVIKWMRTKKYVWKGIEQVVIVNGQVRLQFLTSQSENILFWSQKKIQTLASGVEHFGGGIKVLRK